MSSSSGGASIHEGDWIMLDGHEDGYEDGNEYNVNGVEAQGDANISKALEYDSEQVHDAHESQAETEHSHETSPLTRHFEVNDQARIQDTQSPPNDHDAVDDGSNNISGSFTSHDAIDSSGLSPLPPPSSNAISSPYNPLPSASTISSLDPPPSTSTIPPPSTPSTLLATPRAATTEIRRPTLGVPHDPLSTPVPPRNHSSHSTTPKPEASPYPLTFANKTTSLIKREDGDNADNLSNAASNTGNFIGPSGVLDAANPDIDSDASRVSAYARLDFESFTFYVQTLQVILGRRPESGSSEIDVDLGPAKAISRKHAKIFYNFATQRFELSVLGRNGAFVNDVFVEHDSTVGLKDGTKIQIGQITFTFVLPSLPSTTGSPTPQDQRQDIRQSISDPVIKESPSRRNSRDLLDLELDTHGNSGKNAIGSSTSSSATRKPKKDYLPEEIPEEYREKPPHSYSTLIAIALKAHAPPRGLSLSDIYKAIQDVFPYYQYCPAGWQNSVRHNLSSSKMFMKMEKEGKGWLWGVNEEYYNEKERQKKKNVQKLQKPVVAPPVANSNISVVKKEREKTIAELAREIEVQRSNEGTRLYGNYSSMTGTAADVSGTPQGASGSAYPINTPASSATSSSTASSSSSSLQAGQSTFRMSAVNSHPPSAHPTLPSIQSSVPQMRVQPQIQSSQTPPPGSTNPALNLPKETLRTLAILQQTLKAQLQKKNGVAPSPAVLTNALALAIAKLSKEGGSGIASVLQGKNPAQLAQMLSAALSSVKSEGARSGSPASPTVTAAPSHLTSAVPPTVNAPPTAIVPSNTAPPNNSSIPSIPPLSVPSVPSIPAIPSIPSSLTSPAHPVASSPSSPTSASVKPAKPQPSAADIDRILAQAGKIANPTPEIRAALEQLKAHARKLASAEAKRPSDVSTESLSSLAGNSPKQLKTEEEKK